MNGRPPTVYGTSTIPNDGLPENSISVIQGSTQTIGLVVTDDRTDARVDLTGATVFMTIKRYAEDPAPLIQKTSRVPSQAVITEPREGRVQFYFAPIDTQTLNPQDYVFDIWVVLPTGARFPVIPLSVFQIQSAVTIIPP